MADTDPVATYLAEVRERAAGEIRSVAYIPGDVRWSCNDIPRLLAAVEAVLAAHRPAMDVLGRLVPDPRCQWCREADGQRSKWPCGEFLTVSRALLGEGGTDG